jgi:hypothetical protein
MTSIIWYIYNQFLKKERELLEKARKKEKERRDSVRKLRDSGHSNDEK